MSVPSGAQVTMPPSPEPIAVDRVLAEALDAAHGISDPEPRGVQLEQIGRLAAMQGIQLVFSEVLIDLPDPGGRAKIHYHCALRSLSMGELDDARQHLLRAREGLVQESRWRPRFGWLSKELAAADLARAYAQLGELESVNGLVELSADGSQARASIRRSAVMALQVAGAKGIEVAWERAVKDVLALRSEDDRRRAIVDLGRTAARHGLSRRVLGLVDRAVEVEGSSEIQHLLMVMELGEVLADAGDHGSARTLWTQACDWIVESLGEKPEPEVLQQGVDQLCRLAHAALVVDQSLGQRFFGEAVRRTGQTPLPPDPSSRYPWRTVFRAARQEPSLSEALRELLRKRNVVPPGWCYALGIMELEAGRPDRAERAASALEKGYAFNPSDIEPLWLAALLWARTGQVDRALDAMYPVLEELMEDNLVELPGQSGGLAPVELLFVEALVGGRALGRAAELSRTVIDARLRARLLTATGWAYLAQDDLETARLIASEAHHALEESLRSVSEPDGGALSPALDLTELLWRSGDDADASALLQQTLDRLARGPGVLVIPVLCRHALRVRDLDPLFGRILDACVESCTAPQSPSERCELLLLLAEQIPAS